MEKGAREIALEVLYKIEKEEAYSNLELNGALSKYNPTTKERALTTELVYGVLRRRNTLDWLIEYFSQRPLEKTTVWIRNILRLSAYQLLYLDRIPVSAVCNEGVKLAKKKGHLGVSKFVNGILRNMARNLDNFPWPDEDNLPHHISIKYSHPFWMVERWLQRLGKEETIALCKANNENPPLTIRTNTLRTNRERLLEILLREGVKAHPTDLVPEGIILEGASSLTKLKSYQKGYFQVQDESSMLVAHVVSPEGGENILDACSAPGGKATHLAEKMGNVGKIIANEYHSEKVRLIEENAVRLGIDIIKTRTGDAVNLRKTYLGQMDRVLVDAPCSGLGVLRRKPDARWNKQPEQIKELTEIQLNILNSAAQCVKPGGVLVYSTCSIEPEENQDIVKRFLEENFDFQYSDLRKYLPEKLRENISEGKGYLQLYPQQYGTDGFFLSRLERKR